MGACTKGVNGNAGGCTLPAPPAYSSVSRLDRPGRLAEGAVVSLAMVRHGCGGTT
jgi:hypothetical protein